jgi:hypothetical protein
VYDHCVLVGARASSLGLLVAALSCAHASETKPQAAPAGGLARETHVKALALPPPDSKLYASVRDASAWKNPYLVVQAKGVRVIALGMDATVGVSTLADALRGLPQAAWPYGGVVAAQEQAIVAGDGSDEAPIRTNKSEVVELLKRLGLAVEWWPSA